MTCIALIMAGGEGRRMRASGEWRAKPLVPIHGVTLLERSLYAVLRAGLRQVVVSVPGDRPEIAAVARNRCAEVASSAGADLSVLVEPIALGNIGCAGLLRGRADHVLVTYADNVTTLDLAAVVEHHLGSQPSLTLAAHRESWGLPFGELTLGGEGCITAYREKPVYRPLICSGVAVLAQSALAMLPDDRATGLVELCGSLLAAGETVRAFEHSEAWVDVNDAATIGRAEALVGERVAQFEPWVLPSGGASKPR